MNAKLKIIENLTKLFENVDVEFYQHDVSRKTIFQENYEEFSIDNRFTLSLNKNKSLPYFIELISITKENKEIFETDILQDVELFNIESHVVIQAINETIKEIFREAVDLKIKNLKDIFQRR